jgi:predicted O-methyltransferase YrrM
MNFFLKYTVKNFFLFLFYLAASPFSQAARHKLSAVYLTLQYPFFGPRYIDLSSLLTNDNLRVELAPVKAAMHNVDAFELLSICSLVKDNNTNKVFEIGTYDGRTTMAMSLNLAKDDSHIYTLNLPPETSDVKLDTSVVDVQLAKKVVSGERFLNTQQQNKITQLWGDSATFDFSPYYNSIDFVFIDGAHSEPYVKSDTEKAMQLIKKSGGIIAWHDAHLFGVVKFLQPWVRNNNLPVYFIRNTTVAVARVKDGAIVDFLSN